MQTKKPQTQNPTTTQNKKVIVIAGGGRGRPSDKTTVKTAIVAELRKKLESYVFEIDATPCKPIQAYISSYSMSRIQGLITLLCTSSVGGYKIIANVAFVAKRQDEHSDFEIEKTWIKNAIRLYISVEPKEDFKIVFADELSPK